jgi:SAM-dependent methyltransferase
MARHATVASMLTGCLGILAAASLAAAAPDPAAQAPHQDGAPIECPLHQKSFDPATMRPFAESEKWIEFLDKPDRAAWQKPDEVVAALQLAGNEKLVDVGAGSGYFTFRFAKALPRGTVVATDVDPEMVRHVHHRVVTEDLANVQVVLADPDDPSIPGDADVVFVCDVIHHVRGREAWLRRAFAEMRPGARLVVIEFKEGRLPEGPPEAVKIPTPRLVSMLQQAGFSLAGSRPDLLPYQTFLTFQKPAAASAPR